MAFLSHPKKGGTIRAPPSLLHDSNGYARAGLLLSRVGGHLGYYLYSSWIGLLCREYAFPLLKKAEKDEEVPEPKTKGENKDSTYYLSPAAAAGHRLSRVQTFFCIQENTRLQKSHRIFTLNALLQHNSNAPTHSGKQEKCLTQRHEPQAFHLSNCIVFIFSSGTHEVSQDFIFYLFNFYIV